MRRYRRVRVKVDWAKSGQARRAQARQLGYERATGQVAALLVDYGLEKLEWHMEQTEGFPHWLVLAKDAAVFAEVPEDVFDFFMEAYEQRAIDLFALKLERLRSPSHTLYGEPDIRAVDLGRFLASLPVEARVMTYRGAWCEGDKVSFIENDEEELNEVEDVEDTEGPSAFGSRLSR